MAEMTAVEFLKEYGRMCKMYDLNCSECPISELERKYNHHVCRITMIVHPEETVDIVQKFAEEHPVKTILMDLLEKYPNANPNAIIMELCPDTLGYPKDGDICENGEYENRCQKCWNRPLEE